jgi:hypothetical protein
MVWALLNDDQNAAVAELVETKSERVVAILGGALLEQSLQIALEHRFRPGKRINKELFKVGRPLGNLRAKIHIGFQLYMLDIPVREVMYGLTEIRNLFAHNLSMSFANTGDRMLSALAKLTLHEGKTHYPSPLLGSDTEYELEQTTSPRDKFIVNLKLCLIWLMADNIKHEMWTNTPIKTAEPRLMVHREQ